MGNLPGQKTGVLRGYLQIGKRTHENTLFTGQTSKEGIFMRPFASYGYNSGYTT